MRLKNFLSNTNQLNFVIKGVGQFPMVFDRNTNEWYIDLKSLELPEKHFEYLFVVDERFLIHHPKVLYRKYSEDVFWCVHTGEDRTNNDEIPEIRALGFFVLLKEQIVKKNIFTPDDQVVSLFIGLTNVQKILLLVEWINPIGQTIYVTDIILKPEQIIDNFLFLHRDNWFFGKWTVNIYAEGEKIGSTSFILTDRNKYMSKSTQRSEGILI